MGGFKYGLVGMFAFFLLVFLSSDPLLGLASGHLQLPTQIPNIGTHVIINQKLTGLGLQLHFQRFYDSPFLQCTLTSTLVELLIFKIYCRVVPIAMDRAIKEIVSGIVQRSVSIATQTTKELVLKVS